MRSLYSNTFKYIINTEKNKIITHIFLKNFSTFDEINDIFNKLVLFCENIIDYFYKYNINDNNINKFYNIYNLFIKTNKKLIIDDDYYFILQEILLIYNYLKNSNNKITDIEYYKIVDIFTFMLDIIVYNLKSDEDNIVHSYNDIDYNPDYDYNPNDDYNPDDDYNIQKN